MHRFLLFSYLEQMHRLCSILKHIFPLNHHFHIKNTENTTLITIATSYLEISFKNQSLSLLTAFALGIKLQK